MVSTASGFSKVEDDDLRIMKLLKNVHHVAVVHECDVEA